MLFLYYFAASFMTVITLLTLQEVSKGIDTIDENKTLDSEIQTFQQL